LLEHAEGVLDVEPAQERVPGQIDLGVVEAGAGVPEPQRLRDRAGGQALDFEADHGAFDDR
jgi:hypothetical protein